MRSILKIIFTDFMFLKSEIMANPIEVDAVQPEARPDHVRLSALFLHQKVETGIRLVDWASLNFFVDTSNKSVYIIRCNNQPIG